MASSTPDVIEFSKHVRALSERHGWELVMLGGSLLDVALQEMIRQKLTELKGDERRRFLRGAARDLSSRIDSAWALGLISTQTARECHHLRELRNILGHSFDIDALAHPRCTEVIDRFTYHDRENIDVVMLGVTIEPESYDPSCDSIMDSEGTVGFYVPTSRDADFSDIEVKTRHQIWSCIFAVLVSELGGWINEPK